VDYLPIKMCWKWKNKSRHKQTFRLISFRKGDKKLIDPSIIILDNLSRVTPDRSVTLIMMSVLLY